MKKTIHGVIPPIVTPIDEHERVIEDQLRAMIRHTIDVGMHGIFICGSNGEAVCLTQKERERAIRIAIDECRDQIPLMAGCMDTSTRRVIDNIKRLEQMGGKFAVITAEYYARHSCPDETIRHMEEISKNVDIDLIFYNIPLYTNCALKADAIFEIASFDHMIAYKDSCSMLPETIRCIDHFKEQDFAVMQGITGLAGVTTLIGGDGFLPSIGPVFPKACLKVYEYGLKGDIQKMMRWNNILSKAQSICSIGKNATTATKYLTHLLGLTDERVTLPHEPLKQDEKDLIRDRFEEINKLIEQADLADEQS